jgi:hypothetical protein
MDFGELRARLVALDTWGTALNDEPARRLPKIRVGLKCNTPASGGSRHNRGWRQVA